MHAFAWLLNDLFFGDDFWIGFLIEAVLFFVVAAIAGLIAYRAVQAGAPPVPEMAIEEGKRISQTLESGHDASRRPRRRRPRRAVSNEPEIYRSGAGEPVARAPPGPSGAQLGGDPRRHRAPARGALALGRGAAQPGHRAHRLAPPGPRAPPRADHRRRRGRLRGRRPAGACGAASRAQAQQVGADAADSRAGRGRRGRRSPGRSRRRRRGRSRRSGGTRRPGARAVSGSWMCWTTQASAPSRLALAGELDHALERAAAGADALHRRDLLLERQDRLDLQRRAEPRLGRADPAAAAQVLERVDREPHLQRLAGALDRLQRLGSPEAPPAAARAATSAIIPWPPQPVRLSQTWIRSPPAPSSISSWRAWSGRVVGARDPGGDVDRDDVPALRRAAARRPRVKSPTEGCEVVAPVGAAAQPLEEVVVGGGGDLALAALLAVEGDVEADPVDAVLGDDLLGQVGGRSP